MKAPTKDFFPDAVTVLAAMAHVLGDYLAQNGLVLTAEEREAGFDAHAKLRDASFALVRLTDLLDGVQRTPAAVRNES